MGFPGVGLASIVALMRGVIEFYGRHHAGIRIKCHKIERQLADAVEDRVGPLAALEVQPLQALHLGQNNVVRRGFDPSLVQDALALGQDITLGFQRPGFGERAIVGPEFTENQADHDGRDQHTYIKCQMGYRHGPYVSMEK